METAEVAGSKERDNSYEFDLIVVLEANAHRSEKTGEWKLSTIVEEDPGKIVGGHSRAIAAAQAYKENLSPAFLVTGGIQSGTNDVSRAQLLVDLMVKKYKVPQERVNVYISRSSTQGNSDATVDFLRNHPELLKKKRIGVITNDWHLPRALAMFKADPFFADNSIELIGLPVEELLEKRSRYYKRWAKQVRETPEMETRRRMEETGLRDFIRGEYKSGKN